ncbi:MAG: hypothetical protein GY716_15980 [bacterium]|nr:hypothetical protein [bacterium]
MKHTRNDLAATILRALSRKFGTRSVQYDALEDTARFWDSDAFALLVHRRNVVPAPEVGDGTRWRVDPSPRLDKASEVFTFDHDEAWTLEVTADYMERDLRAQYGTTGFDQECLRTTLKRNGWTCPHRRALTLAFLTGQGILKQDEDTGSGRFWRLRYEPQQVAVESSGPQHPRRTGPRRYQQGDSLLDFLAMRYGYGWVSTAVALAEFAASAYESHQQLSSFVRHGDVERDMERKIIRVAPKHRPVDPGPPIRQQQQEPLLGLATTGELLTELQARAEVDGTLGYRTVDED